MIGKSSAKSVWGLYVEETCVNAVKVSKKGGDISLESFDIIRYSELDGGAETQIDTGPKIQFKAFPIDEKKASEQASTTTSQGVNLKSLSDSIEKAINLFLKKNQINKNDKILVALPSQFVLSRFVKLPSVAKNQLKEIVKFEVQKNIPIETSKIIWDFHSLDDNPAPGKESEVGIFAIKKEDIFTFLSSLKPIKDNLTTVQIGSAALYNFISFNKEKNEPGMLIEVGAANANLMIVDEDKFWIRNIPVSDLGANFVGEIKRSIGYYKSTVKEIDINYLTIIGGIANQQAKKKLIADNLGHELREISLPENITLSGWVDNDLFSANISKLCVPLGIAMQGLALEKININLIPEEFVRKLKVAGKKKVALFSAIAVLIGVLIMFYSQRVKNERLSAGINIGAQTLRKAISYEREYRNKESENSNIIENLRKLASVGEGRAFWGEFITRTLSCIPKDVVLYSLTSKWVTSPENGLLIKIKGKSYHPRLGFVEDMVKAPLSNVVLIGNDGKENPAFHEVKIMPDSIIHDKENNINFEIQWLVKHSSFLLMSNQEQD